MSDDIFLYYSGGSGGFLVLHGLLLCGSHHAYPYGDNPELLINRQWDAVPSDDLSESWRKSEIWPDDHKTMEIKDKRHLYFECNPPVEEFGDLDNSYTYRKDTTKVLIYTDIDTQYELMRFKKAHLFSRWDVTYWDSFYDRLRGESWPNCATPAEVASLPRDIQDILYVDYKKYMDFFGNGATDREMIISAVEYYKNKSDYAFMLEDVIQSNFRIVTDTLMLPHKDAHVELIDKWLNMHPKKLQKLLLKQGI